MDLSYLFILTDTVSLDEIKASGNFDLVSLYELNEVADDTTDNDSPFQFRNGSCTYYEPAM